MMKWFGNILNSKIAAYQYPKSSSHHRFAFLIDETDPNIVHYLSEVEKHPLFKADSKILSFRKQEIPHRYDYSYMKTDLPYNKWPIQKDVESFVSHEFDYFFPLVANWKIHQIIICKLIRAKIKFTTAEGVHHIPWNICFNKAPTDPMEFLKFASTFIDK